MGKAEIRNWLGEFGLLPEIVTELRIGIEPAGVGRNPDVRRLFCVLVSVFYQLV